MTTPEQKKSERWTLDAVLTALGVTPEGEPDAAEAPDFTISISGRTIGVEVTMYHSGVTVDGGVEYRKVETEWELLKRASDAFRNERPKVRKVNVGLMFKSAVPPRKDHQAFMEAIAGFISLHLDELGANEAKFWERHFPSPLMRRYLRTLCLRIGQSAEWYSNITGGWVSPPDGTLANIIAEKSRKTFRPTQELWLAIQCSPRISETVLPIHGVEGFDAVPELSAVLRASKFSRVFVLAVTGIFAWGRAMGWGRLTGKTL